MPLQLIFAFWFSLFSETQSEGFCFREANCDIRDKKCGTRDVAFLGITSSECHFSQNISTVLLAGLL